MALSLLTSRTPPGVRELKLGSLGKGSPDPGRTPPGVRELKRNIKPLEAQEIKVAPLPGCVN